MDGNHVTAIGLQHHLLLQSRQRRIAYKLFSYYIILVQIKKRDLCSIAATWQPQAPLIFQCSISILQLFQHKFPAPILKLAVFKTGADHFTDEIAICRIRQILDVSSDSMISKKHQPNADAFRQVILQLFLHKNPVPFSNLGYFKTGAGYIVDKGLFSRAFKSYPYE